jgi:hypothetical protein
LTENLKKIVRMETSERGEALLLGVGRFGVNGWKAFVKAQEN